MSIRIVVYGSPAPQGSKSFKGLAKSGRAILAESSKKVRPWRQDVKAAAEQVRARLGLALLDEPLRVRMTFTLPKPLSAPKRRVTLPSRLPDLSKLVRSTEDAITDAGVWRDDARVVECTASKRYPGEGADALDAPGCVIEIERLLP
jgi:crossover junction endodeoxyribonuclease RusA